MRLGKGGSMFVHTQSINRTIQMMFAQIKRTTIQCPYSARAKPLSSNFFHRIWRERSGVKPFLIIQPHNLHSKLSILPNIPGRQRGGLRPTAPCTKKTHTHTHTKSKKTGRITFKTDWNQTLGCYCLHLKGRRCNMWPARGGQLDQTNTKGLWVSLRIQFTGYLT